MPLITDRTTTSQLIVSWVIRVNTGISNMEKIKRRTRNWTRTRKKPTIVLTDLIMIRWTTFACKTWATSPLRTNIEWRRSRRTTRRKLKATIVKSIWRNWNFGRLKWCPKTNHLSKIIMETKIWCPKKSEPVFVCVFTPKFTFWLHLFSNPHSINEIVLTPEQIPSHN